MARAPARIIAGGRVTIPADLRRELDLSVGDTVVVDVHRLPEDLDTVDQ